MGVQKQECFLPSTSMKRTSSDSSRSTSESVYQVNYLIEPHKPKDLYGSEVLWFKSNIIKKRNKMATKR